MADYVRGNQVRCTGTFKNSSDAVTDPTTVTIKVQEPDLTQATYVYLTDAEVVKDSTGVYHIDINADAEGRWWYRFEGTGTLQAADEASFYVLDGPFV